MKHLPSAVRRTTYGSTWWGQAWLRALTGIDDANRLPRGRSYARNGMVSRLDIEEHLIEARVRGSRQTPYKVSVGIRRFSQYQKKALVKAITARPHLLSALFAGQVPPDLETLCRHSGMPLFPDSWRDLSMHCSCPDWAVPCKHLAAVLYLVAREIDLDPFLVFRLHGVDLQEELHLTGFLDPDQAINDIPSVTSLLCYPAKEDILPDIHPEEPDYHSLSCPEVRFYECLDPDPAFFATGDFRQLLLRFVRSAIKEALKPPPPDRTVNSWTDLLQTEFAELSVSTSLQVETTWLYLQDDRESAITDFRDLLDRLITLPDRIIPRMSGDVQLLTHAARLARHMIAAGMFWPRLWQTDEDAWVLLWWPVDWVSEWQSVIRAGEPLVRDGLITVTREDEVMAVRTEHRFPLLLALCLSRWIPDIPSPAGTSAHQEVQAFFFDGQPLHVDGFAEKGLAGAIHHWLARIRPASSLYRPTVVIDALPSGSFAGSVRVRDGSGMQAPLISMAQFLEEDRFASYRMEFLKSLDLLAAHSPWLTHCIRQQETVEITENELWTLFSKVLPVLNWLNMPVYLPEKLKGLVKPTAAIHADLSVRNQPSTGGLNLDELLYFQWQIALGDHQISVDEFSRIYERGRSVIRIKDDYLIVDPQTLDDLLDRIQRAERPTGLTLWRHLLAEDFNSGPVTLGNNLRDEIRRRLEIPDIPVPEGLQATLRPYQERGFRWLYRNIRLAQGAIIADDMGLGKTIQLITLMLALKHEHPRQSPRFLVIAPATLLGNWQREIEKFAPGLSVLVYHGTGRREVFPCDVTLTTYGLIRSDKENLHRTEWDLVVIDEAQAIKNARIAQTRSVKALKGANRIAMTGTPVENRLSDYWSIFDFALPGYLGNQSWFEEHFGIPIQHLHDRERLDRFRKMVDPFVLRRMKTDKSILPDLPDKIEVNQYCDLTPEQASLYQARTDSLQAIMEEDDAFHRSGLLFKLLIQLKQICNHPAQFNREKVMDPTRSGKTARFLEIVDEVTDAGEQCLVFTQFREMAFLLERMFIKERGIRPLIIHGGVARKTRDETVRQFQSERNHPVMIVTIKAGGAGLNLTAATQVIHFDLWWNPAVESQATDRAYRIGQDKRVFVHRLICRNTLEEKIDRLIQSKKQLADMTVARGENWIGDLSALEINEIIRLEV